MNEWKFFFQVPGGGAPDSVDVGAHREPRFHRHLDRLDRDTGHLLTGSRDSRRGECCIGHPL